MPIELTPAPAPPAVLGELQVSIKQYQTPVQDVVTPAWTEEITDDDGNVTETIEHAAELGPLRYGTVRLALDVLDADGNRVDSIVGSASDLLDAEKETLIGLGEAFRQRAAAELGLDPR